MPSPALPVRACLALTACLVTATSVLPARATPSVGVQRYLSTSFDVRGGDGLRYAFELVATEAGVGQGLPSELLLDLTQCTSGGRCTVLAKARLPLFEGAVQVAPDLTSGTLSASVAGLHLAAALKHTAVETDPITVHTPGFTLYGLDTAGGGSPRFDTNRDATGRSGVDKASCQVQGHLYSYQGLDQRGDDVRDPRTRTLKLPGRVLAALAAARCIGG